MILYAHELTYIMHTVIKLRDTFGFMICNSKRNDATYFHDPIVVKFIYPNNLEF